MRDKLHRLFHKSDNLVDEALKPFILEYINSLTFADHPDILLRMMKDYTGSILFLADTIFSMCDVFSQTMQKNSREVGTSLPHTISETVTFLLRLYENALAAENTEIANRCLDIWDTLFQNRVGVARDLTEAIEQ